MSDMSHWFCGTIEFRRFAVSAWQKFRIADPPTSNDTQIASGKITNDSKKDMKIDIIDNLYHDHMIHIQMALCFFHAAMWIPQIGLNVPQCCSSNFLPPCRQVV